MKPLELRGQGGQVVQVSAECIAQVEALNHDDSVRCIMCLYRTEADFICQRVDNPESLDVRFRLEHCEDHLSIYQFFGTEPLANFLYGCAGIRVPGLRNSTH